MDNPARDHQTRHDGPRDQREATLRGALGKCPNCGEGRMFIGYLKTVPECAVCGEKLGLYRAADGPAFFTITIVMLLLIPLIWLSWALFSTGPFTLMLFLCGVTTVITLVLLRLVKGIFVAFLWAHDERDRGA